jgi:hypothetical protein
MGADLFCRMDDPDYALRPPYGAVFRRSRPGQPLLCYADGPPTSSLEIAPWPDDSEGRFDPALCYQQNCLMSAAAVSSDRLQC